MKADERRRARLLKYLAIQQDKLASLVNRKEQYTEKNYKMLHTLYSNRITRVKRDLETAAREQDCQNESANSAEGE